jgi:hypothetical protein
LDDDLTGDTPWFLSSSDTVEKRQKVDLNINENGEINFDSTGDLQLSYGLENSIQSIKLKLSIEEGELRRHPAYGLIAVTGYANADVILIREALVDSIVAGISADERFSRVERLDVTYSNPTTELAAVVFNVILIISLAGSGQLVPITFTVKL